MSTTGPGGAEGHERVAERRLLQGWGRGRASSCQVLEPRDEDAAEAVLAEAFGAGRRLIARGLGRSYGDAAQNAGGLVVDLSSLRAIGPAQGSPRAVSAGAGVSFADLLEWGLSRGLFPPVTPGTRHVTLAGALASDVHGKNHHRDGAFSRHVRSFNLATPKGVFEVTREADPELFLATAGGMGLSGVVLSLTLELLPVESRLISVDTERASDLDECMALMSSGDDAYRYSVCWVDCLKRGRGLGRGVLTRGNHVPAAEAGRSRRPGRAGPVLSIPLAPPLRLVSEPLVRAFNEAWFRRAPRRRIGELTDFGPYFYPLDGVGSWNLLYGPRGFTQYQLAVPFGATEVVRRVVETLARRRLPSLLAVLKRFGEQSGGPLSFPRPGWTLALDLPLDLPELAEVLDGFDEEVAAAGGAVYLSKDGRLRPDMIAAMYPRLGEWRAALDRVDPDGLLTSDLARRLHLR